MIKSDAEIYQVLEELLRAAGGNPLTCVDLHDDQRVQALTPTPSPNRISDYLGHMWRRGLVQRWYASKETAQRSRYAYTWIEQADEKPQAVARLTVPPKPTPEKPNITVVEDDGSITRGLMNIKRDDVRARPKFTEQQIKDWHRFEGVRQSGRFNMFDPRARTATGLSGDDYTFVMNNFSELREAARSVP